MSTAKSPNLNNGFMSFKALDTSKKKYIYPKKIHFIQNEYNARGAKDQFSKVSFHLSFDNI